MITPSRLESLAKLESDEGIVSLYVRLEPRLMYERGLAATKFKSALKRFERRNPADKWRRAAERERDRVESFLSDWDNSPALALFACEPADIWEVVLLEAALVPTTLGVDSTTQTRPLAALLDEYPRLVTCVLQRDRATLYVSEQEERGETAEMQSNAIGAHSAGGWSQQRWARHIEVQVDRHLGEVVEAIEKLDRDEPVGRLVLGGTDEITAEVERRLSDSLRERYAGSMPVDVKHASPDEILEGAREVSQNKERKVERDLVGQVTGERDSRVPTVTGLGETLRAISEGRVLTLVLDEDLESGGYECVDCHYLAPSGSDANRCDICNGETETSPNIIDTAVEKAFLDGASINFVFDEAAKRELSQEGGGIGALLRY